MPPGVLLAVAAPAAVVLVVLSYLVGTFPSAHLAGRWRGVDPTTSGSGNPGTTNVLRTAGRRAAVLTLVADLLKGAVPAAVGWIIGGHGLGVVCGAAAIVGHVLPAPRRFQGGKGVATAMGMMIVVYPLGALAGILVFAAVCALTRLVSLGSILATAVGAASVVVSGAPAVEVVAIVLCTVLIWFRHLDNIRRLVKGQEKTSSLRPSG